MTKDDAIAKVAKLRRLARGTANPHEVASAEKRIAELSEKFGLGPADLDASRACAAYDELLDQLNRLAGQLPAGMFDTGTIAGQVVQKLKTAADHEKAFRLRTVVTIVRTAGFFLGRDPTIRSVKTALESALKKHDVTV
jgi:hypothetical protein